MKQRKHLDFEVWEKEALKNPKFKAEYDKLQPEFALIDAMNISYSVGARRIERLSHDPQPRILPLNYAPIIVF